MTHGHLPHVPIGTVFSNRRSLYDAGVHRDIRRGICGSGIRGWGAESIVISGGSEDDIDLGALIYYTGQGSRDSRGDLITDQEMKALNKSLALNADTSEPVRVIRATKAGLRYDGLFAVDDAWLTPGKSGFMICRYRLRQLDPDVGSDVNTVDGNLDVGLPAERTAVTHYRMVRDVGVPQAVKTLYEFACQICGVQLSTVGGAYAEGAHIVPLGFGRAGIDHPSNVLCLCPNHHVLLDHGGISLKDNWTIIDRAGREIGKLAIHPDHGLNAEFARIHRQIMGFDAVHQTD